MGCPRPPVGGCVFTTSPPSPMDTLFGLALGAGGTVGFMQSGSVASLATGVASGAVRQAHSPLLSVSETSMIHSQQPYVTLWGGEAPGGPGSLARCVGLGWACCHCRALPTAAKECSGRVTS